MITAKDIKDYKRRLKGLKTIGEFKKLGREVRDKHKLTDRQALDVLNGNIDKILSLLKPVKTLDRDRVIPIIAKQLELIFYDPEINPIHRNWKGIAGILLDAICKDVSGKDILKLVKTLNEKEVDTIIHKLTKTLGNLNYGICDQITGKPTKDYVLNRQNAIDEAISDIYNLGIEEGKIIGEVSFDGEGI